MSVADVVDPLVRAGLGSGLPVLVRCWDGSEIGPPGAPVRLTFTTPRALRRMLWAPNELGFARAYVSGDILIEGDIMAGLTALDQVAVWRAQGQELTVSVNLSTSSLFDSDLPDQVAAMLAARDLPPHALQLEITEEFLMADRDRARKILTQLRDSGVQISVDDYGTGYSSLSYLRDLPIDELKLDKSFVFPMADDARAAALVASTIDLAHSLGLRMVAEGVETEVAYTELTRLGCDQAQGFFMSRAVPATELEFWLSNRRAAAPTTDTPMARAFAVPA